MMKLKTLRFEENKMKSHQFNNFKDALDEKMAEKEFTETERKMTIAYIMGFYTVGRLTLDEFKEFEKMLETDENDILNIKV